MSDDYNAKTLSAYKNDPKHYEEGTKDMVMVNELATFVSLLPDTQGQVLDAGSAYGRDSAVLSSKGLKVTAIDMTDNFLTRGRELYPDITFKKMDVRELKFEDDTFIGVWCNAVLLHLKDNDIGKAMAEFKRVIVPGGALAVSFKEGTGEREIIDTATNHGVRFYNYKSLDEVSKILEQYGFKVVKNHIVNERQLFGKDKRDLNWIYCYGTKT